MRIAIPAGLLCLILFSPDQIRGEVPFVDRETDASPPVVKLISSDNQTISVLFELSELRTADLALNGMNFHFAEIPGGGFSGSAGDPAIPHFTRLVAIPEGANLSVSTSRLEVVEQRGVHLLPAQTGEEEGFAYNDQVYSREIPDNGLDVEIGEAARLRDLTVVPITFRPVHYNPAARTLTIVKKLKVHIEIENAADLKRETVKERVIPASFDKLYQSLVLNYQGPEASQLVAPGTMAMILPDDPAVADSLQRLIDWKTRKGCPVIVRTWTELGATRAGARQFLTSLYEDPAIPLEYVLIAGDAGSGSYIIPTFHEAMSGFGGEGDHKYGRLDGNDVLQEVHIGRLSFSTLDELSVIVSKIIGYESTPYMDNTDWYGRAVIVGDPVPSGYSTIETGRWLTERLVDIGYTEIDTIFSGNFVMSMYNMLNRGDTVFGYRGIYGMSGWSNAWTYVLSNGWKLPFCVTITCATGSFESATSYAEGFLRAGSINPLVVKGGIGAIGTASTGTHTRYNNCMYYGIWRGLAVEGLHSMGAALTRGNWEVYLNYQIGDPNIPNIWSFWNNLMGDPTVDVWTAIPDSLEVTHDLSLPLGAGASPVTVTSGGMPVEGALVCFWKGAELYETRYTDLSGEVTMPADVTTAGEILVTVSGHNLYPYQGTIPVAAEMHVGEVSVAFDDDLSGTSSGNSDGAANPGESIELAVELHNFGAVQANAVSAILTSNDPFVTITDNSESYGDIPAGNSILSSDDFDIHVASGCPDGHRAQLGLDAFSDTLQWNSIIEFDIQSASLTALSISLFNEGGDGRLDPGETVDLSVQLFNGGSADATTLTGSLVSLSPDVSISDGVGIFGTIAMGDTVDNSADRFTVTASTGTYEGHIAPFLLLSSFSGGIQDTTFFTLTIGDRTVTDPAGPDLYGYFAYDNTDTLFDEAPVYSWVELDPAYGGDGTEVVMNDNGQYQDETVVVTLPFTFSYYGEHYDQASICSNGWIAMGTTALISYRNWIIPGAGGPQAMIAPFWDNLYQNAGSKIFQKYDAANNRWIVQWSRMVNYYSEAEETFQAILYDGAFHQTETGDGPILFQYETVNNFDPINGYATVGIENADQSDGLLCTYWNQYSGGADSIVAGRAIHFVPKAIDSEATDIHAVTIPTPHKNQLDRCRPNPFNPSTSISFHLAEDGEATLRVFDISGRLVSTLVEGSLQAGHHGATWNGRNSTGRDVASGLYFVRLETPGFRQVRELTLVR